MGVSLYNIKRWTKMLTGNSIYHVDQNIGRIFSPGQIKGYYNDLTQKVLYGDKNLANGIPFLEHSDGSHVQMPTMIFQYGLGAYDLWLMEHKKEFLDKVIVCAEWAIEHQLDNGAWSNFFYIYPEAPFSAMSQGEGVSLLLRAYKETNNEKYLYSAKKAIQFMVLDVHNGGVSKYENDDLYLLEYTHLPLVLNGWIFAFFGLYDISLVCDDYNDKMDQTLTTMVKSLNQFDCGFWSLYDASGKITSPFYHNLHIAQMDAMFQITGKKIFLDMRDKWRIEQKSIVSKSRAFIKKAIQKVIEK